MHSPTLLNTIPSAQPNQRLAIFLCNDFRGSHLELHQQSWGAGVGWFTQSRVRVDSDQAAALRQSLGNSGSELTTTAASAHGFRVVHAESA